VNFSLKRDHQATLLELARSCIQFGCHHGQPLSVTATDYAPELQRQLSSFVTLHCDKELRGCIGSLEARLPLVEDVARHAYAAAFQDPRFLPVTGVELPRIKIEISVLSPQARLPIQTEAELLENIQVGIDGITLKDGIRQATFLPTVWEQLPDKQDFIRQLKRKAGLPDNYWSKDMQVFHYRTFCFSE